jgi:hypothetical protein
MSDRLVKKYLQVLARRVPLEVMPRPSCGPRALDDFDLITSHTGKPSQEIVNPSAAFEILE